ncbi:hypothetical protein V5799_007755, partial [Amblyomma americanum]
GVSSTHGSSGVQAGDGGDVPLYRNLSILLPVSVSVLVLIVVVALVMVCFRRQNDAYSAAGTGDENHMGRRGEDGGHEYAEPYAALQAQQQRLLATDAECAAAVAIAYRARCEGASYATIKRSPPRSHIAGYCQEIS